MNKKEIKNKALQDVERLMAPEGYLWAGVPNFKRLFGRDSCIAALQLLKLKPEVARSTLEILAKYQGRNINPRREEEPGKILHEHYVGELLDKLRALFMAQEKVGKVKHFFYWGFPYYGSIDSTAWFLILLSEYFRKTLDHDFVRKLWPNVKMALSWIENYGDSDKDNFIEYQRKNSHGLFHQGWKDGLQINIQPPIAMIEVQGYYYLVYKEVGKLAEEIMGDLGLKQDLEEKARSLKERCNQKFWMEDQSYFALALDGKKQQIPIITSNPGQCLFTGIIEDDKVQKVVRRLFEEDMWTAYGIRTHSSRDLNFDPESYHQGSVWPHDNWVIYKGLLRYGCHDKAEMVSGALIAAYQVLDHMPELYGVKNGRIIPSKISCPLQAWSSGALLNLFC